MRRESIEHCLAGRWNTVPIGTIIAGGRVRFFRMKTPLTLASLQYYSGTERRAALSPTQATRLWSRFSISAPGNGITGSPLNEGEIEGSSIDRVRGGQYFQHHR